MRNVFEEGGRTKEEGEYYYVQSPSHPSHLFYLLSLTYSLYSFPSFIFLYIILSPITLYHFSFLLRPSSFLVLNPHYWGLCPYFPKKSMQNYKNSVDSSLSMA